MNMKSNNFLIFQPSKSAMQSGIAKSDKWCLSNSQTNESFMNSVFCWTGSSNSEKHLTLFFDTLESAVRYAESQKLDFEIIEKKKRRIIKKSYSRNFIK